MSANDIELKSHLAGDRLVYDLIICGEEVGRGIPLEEALNMIEERKL